jgi:hypothetical protein
VGVGGLKKQKKSKMRLGRSFSSSVPAIGDPYRLAKHLEAKHLINGVFRSADSGFDVCSPATGQLIARAGRGNESVVNEAVVAANKAFEVA